METTVGLQLRSDLIDNGFFQTVRRHRADKLDHDGNVIPSVTRQDDLWQSSVAPYIQSKIQWSDKIRTTLGLRADLFRFDVRRSKGNQSRGSENEAVVSPKATISFGPWADTEIYLGAGVGFHSNDARGVRALANKADPLVRTHGSEIGLRTTLLPGLQSTVALWQLDSDGELLFVGDAGTTEATRPSYRYGLELANYWNPTEWLTLDADFSISRSQFRDSDPAGDEIPGSLEKVAAFGITLHDMGALSGSLRLRYFGPRPLIEDDSVRSDATVQLNAQIDYSLTERVSISLEGLNLLGSKDSEIDYFYASRLSGEDAGPDEGGVNGRHFKPVEPFSFRVALTTRF
jgi:outer membrane receptor protein involved in Fe transport